MVATKRPYTDHHNLVTRINVKYRCPTNSDYVLSYPTTEVIHAMYCGGCGKKHDFEPELTPKDLEAIRVIQDATRENVALLDVIDQLSNFDAKRDIRDHDTANQEKSWSFHPEKGFHATQN